MKILMCLNRSFPPDIRVEKEARTLTRAGHEVFILSWQDEGAPAEENTGYATVLRKIPGQSFLKRALRFSYQSLRGIDPLWRGYLADAISKYNFEAIHVHDLPLVDTGLSVARRFNVPLIADLHEMFSVMIIDYSRSFLARCLQFSQRWRQREEHCLKNADRVITISEGGRDFYIKNYSFPTNKLVVVMNSIDLDDFYSFPVKQEIIERFKKYFIIAYTGTISGPHRGIQTVISAMPEIVSKIDNARLLIVGNDSRDSLSKWVNDDEARDVIDKYVILEGWQDHSLFPSYISASDVCLVPHIISSVQTDVAVPHKLFEYMALGKPVIVSSGRSTGQIVRETGAGLVYPSEDVDSLAEAVIRIHDDKGLADQLGQAGLNAVKTKYNWAEEGKKLVDLYRGLSR
jgi:glycosyltransferase involved in cell wall biosynthesis